MLIKKNKCPAIIHAFNTEITDIAGKKPKIVVYTQSKVITVQRRITQENEQRRFQEIQ